MLWGRIIYITRLEVCAVLCIIYCYPPYFR